MNGDEIYDGESHPHQWLDDILKPASATKDKHKIMEAIAKNDRLLDAVQRGIDASAAGGFGSCLWQAIRIELQKQFASVK